MFLKVPLPETTLIVPNLTNDNIDIEKKMNTSKAILFVASIGNCITIDVY